MFCFFLLSFVDFFIQLYFFDLLDLLKSLCEGGNRLDNFFEVIIIFGSVGVFSIGLVHFMTWMGGSQTIIEGKVLLNPSM